MLEIIFFDINDDFINIYKEIIKSNKIKFSFIKKDVESLLQLYKFNAIISPANSFGNMNGGIDRIYKKMFPKIDIRLVNEINNLKLASCGYGYYIPIGSNIIVDTGYNNCNFMIAAPTMFTPRNIIGTDNVYKCFYGILERLHNNNLIIACPCLGTGIGGLTAKESAEQILKAVTTFFNLQNA